MHIVLHEHMQMVYQHQEDQVAACAEMGCILRMALCVGERCEFNFGDRPLAHPVAGYRAIQRPPADTRAAAWLLGAFKRLIASAVSCGWGLSQDTAWVRAWLYLQMHTCLIV